MKKLLILFLIFISNHAFSEEDKHVNPPSYQVVSSVKDSSLKSTEAVFEFTFNVWDQVKNQPSIQLSYNGVNKFAKYRICKKYLISVKPKKYVFKFFATKQYFEITTDSIEIKPGYRTLIRINFQSATEVQYTKKPVIYVYPNESTKVKITLALKGEFLFTYPEYKNGWSFNADPDGTISMNGKKYEYLFWDGKLNIDLNKINWNEGFIVKKEDQVKFFEDKLSQMGLSSREIEDYITYWCPVMSVNQQNYIHFVFNEEYNEYAAMNITPKPDKIFRVYMMWAKASNMEAAVPPFPQQLEMFSRSGFTVVEWGGTQMEKMPKAVSWWQD